MPTRYTAREREAASVTGFRDRLRYEAAHPGMRPAFQHSPYPPGTALDTLWRTGWELADRGRETHCAPRGRNE